MGALRRLLLVPIIAIAALAGSIGSAVAAGPPPTTQTLARCVAALRADGSSQGQHEFGLTLAQARKCAPSLVVSRRAAMPQPDVVYAVPQGSSVVLAGYTVSPMAPGPAAPAGDPCRVYDNWVVDLGVSLHLTSDLCWDYSKSWASWSTANCSSILPAWCLSTTHGVRNDYSRSYSNPCNPWADFYVLLYPGWTTTDYLRQYMTPNGDYNQWYS